MTAKPPTPKIAASELLRRRTARKSFLDFTTYVTPEYEPAWYHRVICAYLDRALDGTVRNLMIFVPPQHGKTTLASHHFPAYAFGRNPDLKVVAASYTAHLAAQNNRLIQRIVDREAYRSLFPDTRLNDHNIRTVSGSYLRNNDTFEIVNRLGSYRCAGVGGGISGYPADLALIDDPIKGASEARSRVSRDAVWDWYTQELLARTHVNSRIVLIQTRWHPDDLAGRLLAHEPERWEVVKLPALCEDPNAKDEQRASIGDALWPERYPVEELESRRTLDPHAFESLYQQNPRPRSNGMFDRVDLLGEDNDRAVTLTDVPGDAKFVRRWDLGASEKGDYTVGVLMARKDDTYYIVDVVRIREHPQERNARIMTVAERDAATWGSVKIGWPQDPGAAGKDVADYFVRMMKGYPVYIERETGDKETRAEPFAAQVRGGNVRIVRAAWNEEFLSELESFPGTHDDQVDAASGAFMKLTKVSSGGGIYSLAG